MLKKHLKSETDTKEPTENAVKWIHKIKRVINKRLLTVRYPYCNNTLNVHMDSTKGCSTVLVPLKDYNEIHTYCN